jgi:putative DNA methylase
MSGVFNAPIYGHDTWATLFTPRQALALTTVSSLVRSASVRIAEEHSPGLAVAVSTCLALALDRLADSLSSLCRWRATSQDIGNTFGRQALPMLWDFAEANLFSGSTRDWMTLVEGCVRALESADVGPPPGHTARASATALPLPDASVQAVVTDPPYYNAVPYADLSDFFYVWLRRTLGDVHPELFSAPLAPKDEEICEMAGWDPRRYGHKGAAWFELQMKLALSECRRVLAPEGIAVVVFAHKATAAWEALLQAVVDAGWTITASWPIDTEKGSRLRAMNSAVLGSSIHLVCRPREVGQSGDSIGDWRTVLEDLPHRIRVWMPRLASEGIVGADAIFACLGPALEVYSRYARVEKANGDLVPLGEYLEHVWAAVSREALSMIFGEADASGFEEDARLTAMWLWTLASGSGASEQMDASEEADDEGSDAGVVHDVGGGYALEYDAARKIAQGLGVHLDKLDHLAYIKGDTARLVPVVERTKYLFGKEAASSPKRAPNRQQVQLNLFEELRELGVQGAV